MTRVASAVLIAVLLGGCAKPGTADRTAPGAADAHQPGQPTTASGSGGAPRPTDPAGATGGSSGATGAKTDADRLLAAFVPPDGAVRLAAVPTTLATMDWAVSTPAIPQLVRALGWWRVPGDPAAVLAAIKAAPPVGSTVQGTASSGRIGANPESQAVTFAWPDDGVLRYRQLQVATARLGADTVIRAEALVAYADPKPVAAEIGPQAVVAVVSLVPRANAGVSNARAIDPPEPVTVTDPAKVAKLAAIINAAPTQVGGVRHCPMMTLVGSGMTVVFEATVAGPKIATVYINTNGCQSITVTPAGSAKPVTLDGGIAQIDQIIDVLGVGWPKQS